MRSLSVVLIVGLLGALVSACGGARKTTTNASTAPVASAYVATGATSSSASQPHLPRPTGNPRASLDVRVSPEDRVIYSFYGHPADTSDRRVIVAHITRYYAAALAGDGKSACSMILPSLISSLPLEYGQLGPSYLHGAKTCQAVLSRMFEHRHSELSVPIAVTGVYIKGEKSFATIDSKKMPPSMVLLLHERGTWIISQALGNRIQPMFLPRHK